MKTVADESHLSGKGEKKGETDSAVIAVANRDQISPEQLRQNIFLEVVLMALAVVPCSWYQLIK